MLRVFNKVAGSLILTLIASSCSNPQELACRKLSEEYVQKQGKDLNKNYTLIEWNSFYSKKYDACIHTERRTVGMNFFIGDLSRTIRRGHYWYLLNCDQSGADRVIIDSLRRFNGREDEAPSNEYLDDGSGGKPRSLQTPPEPWTRERCQAVFDRVITELKS